MRDGTETLQHVARDIDIHVLRHMLLETSDLLDESSTHVQLGASNTQAAMVLARADATLLSVFAWLSAQMRKGARERLASPLIALDIAPDALSGDLARFAERVDRLQARALRLESLVSEAPEEPTEPRAAAQVLEIFGETEAAAQTENPVHRERRRLHWALGGQ